MYTNLVCLAMPWSYLAALYDDTAAYGTFPRAQLWWGSGMLPVWGLFPSLSVLPTN